MRWPDLFIEAMGSLEKRMPIAMQANGCRESWLQAEVMMYADQRDVELWVNTEKVRDASGKELDRQRHDWAAYEDGVTASMVSEVKIMAGHFSSAAKCLLGSRAKHLSAFLPGAGHGKRLVTNSEIQACTQNDWGLLPDAARLLRHPANERYLVLVLLDLYVDSSLGAKQQLAQRQCHRAMEQISFADEGNEWNARFEGYSLRIWRLA